MRLNISNIYLTIKESENNLIFLDEIVICVMIINEGIIKIQNKINSKWTFKPVFVGKTDMVVYIELDVEVNTSDIVKKIHFRKYPRYNSVKILTDYEWNDRRIYEIVSGVTDQKSPNLITNFKTAIC